MSPNSFNFVLEKKLEIYLLSVAKNFYLDNRPTTYYVAIFLNKELVHIKIIKMYTKVQNMPDLMIEYEGISANYGNFENYISAYLQM